MDHVLSTQLFVKQRLTTALLDRILASGIPAVELFVNRQHLDYLNTAQIHEIASWFRDSKLELWALHSPMYSDDQNGLSARIAGSCYIFMMPFIVFYKKMHI